MNSKGIATGLGKAQEYLAHYVSEGKMSGKITGRIRTVAWFNEVVSNSNT